ncbi:hypothetical protein Gogos_021674, partial [Gossypium gossypioides]|nr:hypothetical protein [Gossypium gossypioides]
DVAADRLIKDNQGRWILGFNKRLDQCSVFNAELWDILDGLLFLQNRHCDKMLIKTNSMKELEYIPKEKNSKADPVTKIAFERNEGL